MLESPAGRRGRNGPFCRIMNMNVDLEKAVSHPRADLWERSLGKGEMAGRGHAGLLTAGTCSSHSLGLLVPPAPSSLLPNKIKLAAGVHLPSVPPLLCLLGSSGCPHGAHTSGLCTPLRFTKFNIIPPHGFSNPWSVSCTPYPTKTHPLHAHSTWTSDSTCTGPNAWESGSPGPQGLGELPPWPPPPQPTGSAKSFHGVLSSLTHL